MKHIENRIAMNHKYLVSALLSVMLSVPALAQWTLTPEGFKTTEDKDYIVVLFESLSASDMLSKTKTFVATNFVSPKDVISVADDAITINAHANVGWKGGIVAHVSEVHYTISIQFKDGRIRVNAPYLSYIDVGGKTTDAAREIFLVGPNLLGVDTGIFKPNGKETKTFAPLKVALEQYMNIFVESLKSHIEGKDEEDW